MVLGHPVSDALVAMQHLAADAIATGADRIDPDALAEQVRRYRSAAQIGLTEPPPARTNRCRSTTRSPVACSTGKTTTCASPPAGQYRPTTTIRTRHPHDQTAAEGVRCLRTLTGAKQFCAIRSYLSTAAKHGRNFFDTFVMLAESQPWLPATT